MEEDFEGPGSVAIEMALQIHDGGVTLVPDGFVVAQFLRKPLSAKQLRMHPNDQHLLVIGAIEDADLPANGKTLGRTPEEIVLQFFWGRLFETGNLTALRIAAGQ